MAGSLNVIVVASFSTKHLVHSLRLFSILTDSNMHR